MKVKSNLRRNIQNYVGYNNDHNHSEDMKYFKHITSQEYIKVIKILL